MFNVCYSFRTKLFQTGINRRPGFNSLRTVIAISLIITSISCDNYREADPVITRYAEVKDPSRDTIISIFNEKLSTKFRVTFEETLSDTALVRISNDTLFSQHGTLFLLPITNPPLMFVDGLTGDSLFIKYQPIKKPISGNVKIGITFQ